ncbi:MAG TPA: hypothetical protein VNF73_14210 [Candidatus Saccharimonadales bacterium]|nr:hypothetical protein [Candidatus Saccharimonadales bacterium]
MTESVLGPAIEAQIARLGRADMMVGIPSYRNAATIGHVVRAAQAGLVQYFPDLRPVLVNADGGSSDGTPRVVIETEPPDYIEQILLVRPTNRLARVSLTYPDVDGVSGKGAALRTIFEIAAAVGVQALVVVDSDVRSIVPEWIELLAGPIVKGGYDFVAPLYTRDKYDGTITNTVTYPLTRALYGLRIRQPMGGDFGVSGDLVRAYLKQPTWGPDVSRFGIDIWMTTTAVTAGYAVCQTRLGAKIHDPRDPGTDLGSMFREVMRTAIELAIRNASTWLPVRGSHDVPAYGFERVASPLPLRVNPIRLLATFNAGASTMADTWHDEFTGPTYGTVVGLAHEAGRIVDHASRELRLDAAEGSGDLGGSLTTEAMSEALADFTFPDEWWARVIYDAILAARADPGSIEAIVSGLLPIYLGRVGSLVIAARGLDDAAAEELVERQAQAFELEKAYLVERWQSGSAATSGSAAAAPGSAATSGSAMTPGSAATAATQGPAASRSAGE